MNTTSPRVRIAAAVLVVLVAWAIANAVLAVSAYAEARKGQQALTTLSSATLESLQSGAQDASLESATQHLETANRRLSNPLLAPLRPVPLVGPQVRSGMALTDAGAESSATVLQTLRQMRELSERPANDRAAVLAQVASICSANDERLRRIDLGPRSGLLGPLSDARSQAVDRLNQIDNGLVRAGAASSGLSSLLSNPSNYLLIAANNAEMRNGSGMFLQAGLLQTGNGTMKVSDMGTVGSLVAPSAEIKWPGDVEANWGWLNHQGDFRNLMLSPRYDVSATIAKQIWESRGKPKVDGVITLDIALLQALLAVTGPVTVEGRTLDAAGVTRALLFEQYASATGSSNRARREALADVAEGVFGKFASGDWDLIKGAKQLGEAAQGRHLLLWSVNAELNSKWVTAGVGGVLRSDSTSLAVVNLGTNKLDQFLEVDSTLEVNPGPDSLDTVMTIRVRNNAPANGPVYVLGPNANSGAQPGEYIGMLALSLPGDVRGPKFDGDLPLSVAGRDGQNIAVATGIDVPRGNAQTFVLRYSQPRNVKSTVIEPSARIPGLTWHYRDDSWRDNTPHRVVYQ